MAALAIPLITTLEPVVIPLIVRLMDKIFGSKTGAAKLATAATVVHQIAQGVAGASTTAVPVVPSLEDITASVQKVVDSLNAQGQLQGPATVVSPTATAPVIIAPGQPDIQGALEGISEMLAGFVHLTSALHGKA